jgi:hypothetical protein
VSFSAVVNFMSATHQEMQPIFVVFALDGTGRFEATIRVQLTDNRGPSVAGSRRGVSIAHGQDFVVCGVFHRAHLHVTDADDRVGNFDSVHVFSPLTVPRNLYTLVKSNAQGKSDA